MDSPKERDQRDRDAARTPLSVYESRHGYHRLPGWWLCPDCWLTIAPHQRHRGHR